MREVAAWAEGVPPMKAAHRLLWFVAGKTEESKAYYFSGHCQVRHVDLKRATMSGR